MNTEIVAGTGVGVKTGIVCDDRLETGVKGIFAAGDVAEFYDPIAEMNYRMGTWNNAGAHGKVVAINMAGGDERYHDVPEYSSKLFTGQTITQFGISPEYRAGLETVRKIDREKKTLSRALLLAEPAGRGRVDRQRESRGQTPLSRSHQDQGHVRAERTRGIAGLDRGLSATERIAVRRAPIPPTKRSSSRCRHASPRRARLGVASTK